MKTFVCLSGSESRLALAYDGAFALIDEAGGEWLCYPRPDKGVDAAGQPALAELVKHWPTSGQTTLIVQEAADVAELRRRLAHRPRRLSSAEFDSRFSAFDFQGPDDGSQAES